MKPQGKPWTPVPPQRGGVFTIATPRSDAVNVIKHSRAPLSSQIKNPLHAIRACEGFF